MVVGGVANACLNPTNGLCATFLVDVGPVCIHLDGSGRKGIEDRGFWIDQHSVSISLPSTQQTVMVNAPSGRGFLTLSGYPTNTQLEFLRLVSPFDEDSKKYKNEGSERDDGEFAIG